jgi:3-phosphoshikimate 1-carboxyvinyltransferase
MRRVQEPLVRMGAKVDLLGRDGRPPVRIAGAALEGIEYTMPVASAQVKSCALLAGLFARGVTSVVEPRPTRDHTERMLGAMGAPIEVDGARVTIRGAGGRSAGLRGRTWRVPGDFSSAAFWLGAAAARSGRTVTVTGVGLNPRRTAFLDVLTRMGAAVSVRATGTDETCEPVGDVTVTGSELAGTTIAGDEVPNLIDELPLVAVLAATARGETTIRDASELRYKESDRVATVAEGLRAVGADARELPDGMTVRGRERVRGDATVNSRGDHRIAMSFAVLALGADAPVAIRDTACVATSYPGFWDDLRRLT